MVDIHEVVALLRRLLPPSAAASDALPVSCAAGSFLASDGSCEPCAPGSYAPDAWPRTACAPCLAGRVAFSAGSAFCATCPDGTRSVDGVRCEACPTGTIGCVSGLRVEQMSELTAALQGDRARRCGRRTRRASVRALAGTAPRRAGFSQRLTRRRHASTSCRSHFCNAGRRGPRGAAAVRSAGAGAADTAAPNAARLRIRCAAGQHELPAAGQHDNTSNDALCTTQRVRLGIGMAI